MAGNRAKAEAICLKLISKIIQGEPKNIAQYKAKFAAMNDKQFEEWIKKLESEEEFLTIEAPNFGKHEITVENNFKIAEEIGHKFFQKVWIQGKGDTPDYLTPIEYLICDIPGRRPSQLLNKKTSVPKHNKVIDALTGQPTGESKGAKLSYPEIQVLTAMGMESSVIELAKYRGGDARGRAALSGLISKHGQARQETLQQYASGVESTVTLKTFLTAAHLRNNL